MPTDPKSFPEEYLYSLSRPSAPPPKKRRWWIAVPAALLLLLFSGTLALSRRGGDPSLHTETHREETSVQSDTEAAEVTSPVSSEISMLVKLKSSEISTSPVSDSTVRDSYAPRGR